MSNSPTDELSKLAPHAPPIRPEAVSWVRVCSLKELQQKGRLLIRGAHRPILLLYDNDRAFALDNRCPHMGFPLERGTVENGILTCHWHHARFDVASGCTFDLWADDVPTCRVEIRDGEVWLEPHFQSDDLRAHWQARLQDGLAHNLSLVMAKSVQGQLAVGQTPADIVRQAVLFGARNRDGWGTGLTILTALANVLPYLRPRDVYLALFQGVRRVAADCQGVAPRRDRAPLESRPDLATLQRWMHHWTAVRHRDGAERTLLTAIAGGVSPSGLAALLGQAATDRVYADGGHSLDFVNKAFECLDLIGWEHAPVVLPTVVGQMVESRGAEEETSWRHPEDLVAMCEDAEAELRELFRAADRSGGWAGHRNLAHGLLADSAEGVIASLRSAVGAGATPADIARSLAYAAALRVAQFGTSNEHADWETAHHVFTYANAVHQLVKRVQDGGLWLAATAQIRGILHGAMAVYLARYLNIPPARLPGEATSADLPDTSDEIQAALLDTFDRQRQVDTAATLVAHHLRRGYAPDPLLATLGEALLREDAGFHAYQMLEAGVRQLQEWRSGDEGTHILVAVARYLAAHSPTERAAVQTAEIALRLLHGSELHE